MIRALILDTHIKRAISPKKVGARHAVPLQISCQIKELVMGGLFLQ